MTYDRKTLIKWRAFSQLLENKKGETPLAAAEWLVGVQAQDARAGKWALGQRTLGSEHTEVSQALRDHRIVHTWMMRGSLHYIAITGLVWLRLMLSPGIIRGNTRRYQQLELDDAVFEKSQHVLLQALKQEGTLTRAQIKTLFERSNVPAEGQQLPYLLQRAALDGLICLAEERKHKPAYTLLPDLSCELAPDGPDALGLLAQRYFASRGPATVHDFAWWSGISMRDARQAVEAATGLNRVEFAGREYFCVGNPPADLQKEFAALLPAFDEYLLGYKDRSLMLDPAHVKKVNAGGGMFKPVVMVNGEIVGVWSSKENNGEIHVIVWLFQPIGDHENLLIEWAAGKLGHFHSSPVKVKYEGYPAG